MEEETFKYEIYYTGLFKKDFKKFLNDETKVKKITDTITLYDENGADVAKIVAGRGLITFTDINGVVWKRVL